MRHGFAVLCVVLGALFSTIAAHAEEPVRELSPPVECGAAEEFELVGRTLRGAAVAVSMAGACDARIEDTVIEATEIGLRLSGAADLQMARSSVLAPVALVASGTAEVTLEGVTLEGSTAAIVLSGAAKVTVRNSTIVGKVETSGRATVIDAGGNTFVN